MPEVTGSDAPRLVRRALARADAGKTLTLDEATSMMAARGEELDRLMGFAARLRDLEHGEVVTYSRKVFIPLTMLCRDHCHYCTFAKPPAKLDTPFLTPEEAVSIADAGRRMGCKEALFTLGDRPEERYDVAREWLEARGYGSTLDYVRAVAIRVIEETGLLPHLNPGVMSYEEIARLKQVSASMGMMLETSSMRLAERGGPHFGSPDKVPAVRLRTIEDAGRLAVPFTTGILVGIGETDRERAESLFAIRDAHRRYRHIQEVIVQNFRAKPGTAMQAAPEPDDEAFLAAVATARVVLGPRMHLQAPPNLSDPDQQVRLLDAGIDDWGGVSPLTPDHVNPEKPWPSIEALAATTASRGKQLRERLTIYPAFAAKPDPYLAGKMRAPVMALLGSDGRAVEGRHPEPIAWQDPDVQWKPRTIALTFAKADGTGLRGDADEVYGDADTPETTRAWSKRAIHPERIDRDIVAALSRRRSPSTDLRRTCVGAVPSRRSGARCAVSRRRPPPCRGRRRRRDLRRQPEHQLHERLLRGVPVLRVRATRDGCRVLHADPRRGRRSRRGSVGARRHRGVHAGRDPPRPAGLVLLRSARRGEGPDAGHAHPRLQPHGGHERVHETRSFLRRVPRRGEAARPGNDPRDGRRDLGRRGPLGAHEGQAPRRHVGGDRPHRTRSGHPELQHDHVRPCRCAAPLGGPSPPAGADPGRHRRVHGVRAAAVRPSARADLSGGQGSARCDLEPSSCGCTRWRASCSTDSSRTSRSRG